MAEVKRAAVVVGEQGATGDATPVKERSTWDGRLGYALLATIILAGIAILSIAASYEFSNKTFDLIGESPYLTHFLTGGAGLVCGLMLNYILGLRKSSVNKELPDSYMVRTAAVVGVSMIVLAIILISVGGTFADLHLENPTGNALFFSGGIGLYTGLALAFIYNGGEKIYNGGEKR